MKLHCDKCGKVCPPFDEATKNGWYLSSKLSVSGVPWDMVCPECLKNKYEPQNKEVDFTFYPTKDFKECPVCGICSFPHIHRKGTLPKDFERIEPENKSTNEEWEKDFFVEFPPKEYWSRKSTIVNRIFYFIRQKLSQAEEEGYQRGYKEGVDDTLDEYGDGPSS